MRPHSYVHVPSERVDKFLPIGMGAESPSDDAVLAWSAHLPCDEMHPGDCLDAKWRAMMEGCAATRPPEGVTEATWAVFCGKAAECGIGDKPDCGLGGGLSSRARGMLLAGAMIAVTSVAALTLRKGR